MNTAVLGGGSWGTALAAHLAQAGHAVCLWARQESLVHSINQRRENPIYLPGIELPQGILASTSLEQSVEHAETVLVVIPSEFCRGVYRRLAGCARADAVLVSATKGIELDSLKRMSAVAAEELPGHPVVVLSGPSFALEVARREPTVVVLASTDAAVCARLQERISDRTFRAYVTDDVIGVELAGALKNVIAIAAGILEGLGHGSNTTAALVTRGLAEVSRLAQALGGRPDTLAGLAGLGDLVLTCTGSLSRNRRLGAALGRGLGLDEAIAETAMIAEGVRTTLAACHLARGAAVEMPIAEQMREVLYENKPPRQAIDDLMRRRLKRE